MHRRTMLAGLAGLPLAAASLPALAAAASPDPFTGYGAEILALHAAIQAGEEDEEQVSVVMGVWRDIDAKAMAGRPTTLAGAAGALEYARREFVQFYVEPHENSEDTSSRLILHLLDGAIAVLRQAVEGGRAHV